MLIDHVLKVLICRNGDQAIEVFVGEMVFEGEWAAIEQALGEVRRQGGERSDVAVHHHDSGISCDAAK